VELVWCEIDDVALADNIRTFRALQGPDVRLAVAVKANAYGHGLIGSALAFMEAGADWLCVHDVHDAIQLRAADIEAPIYLLGPILERDLERAVQLNVRMVVYSLAMVDALIEIGQHAKLHLKIETGNHRQGVTCDEALAIAARIAEADFLELEGVSSHFANIEDTTDHRYAREQLTLFDATVQRLNDAGHTIAIRHLSNSAAALLWPDQAFEMVRVGISAYGLWPSKETRVAAALAGRGQITLRPALTWKARVAQVKNVPEGAYIGYGCTFMTTHDSQIAILPVGYFDGYDRGLSNLAHVLIHGQRAPVRGRVCMNLLMVDVTDIAGVNVGDEAVLLGTSGQHSITAESLGDWAGSINYEVISRIAGHIPRLRVSTSIGRSEMRDAPYRAPPSDTSD
jgi:alanine racemase